MLAKKRIPNIVPDLDTALDEVSAIGINNNICAITMLNICPVNTINTQITLSNIYHGNSVYWREDWKYTNAL